jgi:hypothetical protein
MEQKIKHLEFIQLVIARTSSHSFLIKGWTITLISALFALAAKDSNVQFALISYIVIPVFWILDGFFIASERRYRALYQEVRAKAEPDIDFNMNTSKFDKANSWLAGIFSKTLYLFYGTSILTTIIVMCLSF